MNINICIYISFLILFFSLVILLLGHGFVKGERTEDSA